MTGIQITIHPAYKVFTPFVENIHAEFEQSGVTIYKERNEIKVYDVDGTKVNVKRFALPIWINRFAYTYVRPSKAERSYRYASLLREKGVDTPDPIAEIRLYEGGLLSYSYFISRQEIGYDTLYHFGNVPLAGNEEVVKALARYTAQLHQKEFYHKDYSPGNILYRVTEEEVKFSIVDINRMKFGPVAIEKGCAAFARLWGQDDFFELLAREYAKARNADMERCIQWVFAYRRKFWKKYARKHGMPFPLAEGGDLASYLG